MKVATAAPMQHKIKFFLFLLVMFEILSEDHDLGVYGLLVEFLDTDFGK